MRHLQGNERPSDSEHSMPNPGTSPLKSNKSDVVSAFRWTSEQALTIGTAPALDQPVAVRIVVVGQLFALPDPARGADPDDAVLDLDIAVGPARMIDEARDVAADTGVDGGPVGQF